MRVGVSSTRWAVKWMHRNSDGRMGDQAKGPQRTVDLSGTAELADECATEALGARVGRALRAGDLVALDGPLGSGKTCLVRGIAHGMGIDRALVTSPSFILMQRYRGAPNAAPTAEPTGLVHIDAWRMRSELDLADLGLDEIVAAGRDVIALEWPSKVQSALPQSIVRITLTPTPTGGRVALIEDQRDRGCDLGP